MVVDIQGVGNRYTDPVVLTPDGRGYGAGNIGRKGMDEFFETHRCNPICLGLGLQPVFFETPEPAREEIGTPSPDVEI